MIIYQFNYIWPTSFTEYVIVEVTWRVMPSRLRLKISRSNTQGMTPSPPTLKSLVFFSIKFISSLTEIIHAILISGSLQSFFYSKLFICPPDEKNTKMFQGFYPKAPPGLCHRPIAELTAPQDAHLHFITFQNSIFVQKGTLVKLLE